MRLFISPTCDMMQVVMLAETVCMAAAQRMPLCHVPCLAGVLHERYVHM